MKTSFFKSIFILAVFSSNIFAQGEAALPFLNIPLSPNNIGIGGAGAALFSDNEFGFLMNPAMIGYQGKENHIGLNIYPSKTNMGSLPGIKIFGSAFTIGYNFEEKTGVPIGLGFGFAYGNIDYDIAFNPNPIYIDQPDRDKYSAFSFGAMVDLGVEISTGFSVKKINSVLSLSPLSSISATFEGKITAFDFGLFVNVPISELLDLKSKISKQNGFSVWPISKISFGYSVLNVGDEIYYVDKAQSDPLPRTERLGYGISLGLGSIIMNKDYELLGIDFTVDAENLLVGRRPYFPDPRSSYWSPFDGTEYKSLFSEINIFDNLIGIKGNENVVVHSGLMINLFETVSILKGHFSGRNYGLIKSNGFIVQSNGAFKMLSSLTDNSTFKFFLDNFNIKYSAANYLVDQPGETKFNSLSFSYSGTLF